MNSADELARDGTDVLAVGANRVCVIDRENSRFCLKYERPLHERTPVGARQALRRRVGQWFAYFGDNHSELRAYRGLRQRLGNATDGVLAACHDIVATAHGPALRCDCVRDADGAPAPSLYRCLFGGNAGEDAHDRHYHRRYGADDLCAAVDRMEAWLLRHRVPLFDLNSGNFAVIEARDVDGGVRLDLICIDLKSLVAGKEILPISRWIPALAKRKVRRRAERLRQRIRDALQSPPSTLDDG
jgi:PhoP regulatory network protein YrbL